MTAEDFDDRVARLEEHLVDPGPKTAEDWLTVAEERLAKGPRWEQLAAIALERAKLARWYELDEAEELDDDA